MSAAPPTARVAVTSAWMLPVIPASVAIAIPHASRARFARAVRACARQLLSRVAAFVTTQRATRTTVVAAPRLVVPAFTVRRAHAFATQGSPCAAASASMRRPIRQIVAVAVPPAGRANRVPLANASATRACPSAIRVAWTSRPIPRIAATARRRVPLHSPALRAPALAPAG